MSFAGVMPPNLSIAGSRAEETSRLRVLFLELPVKKGVVREDDALASHWLCGRAQDPAQGRRKLPHGPFQAPCRRPCPRRVDPRLRSGVPVEQRAGARARGDAGLSDLRHQWTRLGT